MTDQYLGEIRPVGFNFAPQGWALCNGQLMAISQNTALFSLLGTNYGGNGTSTFGLPNLQGMFPMAQGNGVGLTPRVVGESGGLSSVTLTQATMAGHSHVPQAAAEGGSTNSPSGAAWAEPRVGRVADLAYVPHDSSGTAPMLATALGTAGSSQPHNNLPPYLVINFVIALEGIFPARG